MAETLFSTASLLAIGGWLLLATATALSAAPLQGRLLWAGGRLIPLLLAALYVAVLATHWGAVPGGGFATLATVSTLFAVPGKMLGGWIHFLAFDLLVGRWMVDDALRPGRSRLALVPALPLAFVFGPAGWLLHLGLQAGIAHLGRQPVQNA